MIVLKGNEKCKIDGNGRCKFPASFKKQLGNLVDDGFVLKSSIHEKCLELWTSKAFEENLLKRTACLNDNNRFDRMLKRKLAEGNSVWLDNSERFIISPEQKKHANLGESIVFLGVDERIEVWNEEELNNADADILKMAADKHNEEVDWSKLAEERLG
ncbi:MAG: division/cell wall cluster transcriptional repressor MraZ [Bacteroidales bacterium]|jgi:MraZ protein|nr:division/cell wall cluster transcriptional repressor MraZ [Bacteroidales bacterium]